MDKEEIYKKIFNILEKKINHNQYNIQQNILEGGSQNSSSQLAITNLVRNVGESQDIKNVAEQSFARIIKHSQK